MQTFPQVSVYKDLNFLTFNSFLNLVWLPLSWLTKQLLLRSSMTSIFLNPVDMLALILLVFSVGINTVGHSPSRITYFLGFHDIALSKLPLTF